MTAHLTSQHISEAMVGTLAAEPAQHLRECSACREKLESFQSDLALFGSTVRNWTDGQALAKPVPHAKRPFFGLPRLAIAGLVFAALLIAVFRLAPSRPQETVPPAVTDAALLQQVDAALAETVPGPMEPLNRVIAVDAQQKNAIRATAPTP